MYRAELQKLEGVWTGTELVDSDEGRYEASARWEFRTLFDGRFLVADYVQTAPDRPTSVGHGVFCKADKNAALTVTWFRDPSPTTTQQAEGTADGEMLIFLEKIADTQTRTTYSVALNRLSIKTERSVKGGAWTSIFDGSYRRPRG